MTTQQPKQNQPGAPSPDAVAAVSPDSETIDVRIVRGNPTDDELAAVLAVLHSLPPAPAHRPAATSATRSDWQQTQRPLRTTPLRRPWH